MTEPTTANIGLIVPNTGDLVGTWGSTSLNPDLSAVDGYLGGVQIISASNAPITLTSPAGFIPTPSGGPTQSQNGVIRFTGALTSNVSVTLPLPGYTIIENLTTGAGFILQFRAIGGGQVICIQQGACRHVYNDGTNVRFVNLPDVGTYLDVAASSIPAWITNCSIPPYLNCDGTTFNAATYPFLNAFLGGNILPDFRGVSPGYLNQGTGRLTNAVNGNVIFSNGGTDTITLAASQIPSITSAGGVSVTSVATNIITGILQLLNNGTGTGGVFQGLQNGTGNAGPVSSSGTASVTSNNTGGQLHSNTQPTTIAGLRLIRAA